MLARRVLLLAGAAASILVACQVLIGIENEDGVPHADAATEEAAAPDASDPCQKHAPPVPLTSPGPGTGLTYVFAMRNVRIRPRGEPPIGYDLDNLCTGDDASTTSQSPCRPPGELQRDDEGGIDNAFGRVLDQGFGGGASDPVGTAAESNVARGLFTVVFALADYNGKSDQDGVQLSILPSPGIAANLCDGGLTEAGGPLWNGCDSWSPIERSGVTNRDGVILPSTGTRGYVRNNLLLVRMEKIPFGLGLDQFIIEDGYVTATIEHTPDGGIRLTNGIVAGRVDATALIRSARGISLDFKLLCENTGLFEIVRSTVCSTRDIPLRQADDGKGLTCQGLSFAIGFVAEPARLAKDELAGRDGGCPANQVSACDTD